MEVAIIYFSQTGNTQKVARTIADVLYEHNHRVSLIALENANTNDAVNCDLVGIGTPCFTSRAPQPVIGYLDSLPVMKHHKAFVFATCGGAPGKVLFDTALPLQKKGVDVLAGHLTRGEVHHPAPSLKGRFPGRPNAEDLNRVRIFATVVNESVSSKTVSLSKHKISPISRKWGFYDFLGSAIRDSTVRLLLPAPKVNLAFCDQCGYCSKECPTHNIILEPYPVLGNSCIRCYHCYNVCPGEAFGMNWQVGNPIIWLLYNQVFERWFGDIKPGEQIY